MEIVLSKETSASNKNAEKCSHSQEALVPEKLNSTEINHDEDTHKHFSIRGFTADARKRDIKLCFPLFSSDNWTAEKQLNLEVKTFRRWDCPQCLREITNTELVNGNEDIQNEHHSLIGNTKVVSQPSAIKTIFGLPQKSEEKFRARKVAEKEGAIGRLQVDLTKKDISTAVPKSSQDRSHKDEKFKGKAIIVATEEEHIVAKSKTSKAAKNKINVFLSKQRDKNLVSVGEASNQINGPGPSTTIKKNSFRGNSDKGDVASTSGSVGRGSKKRYPKMRSIGDIVYGDRNVENVGIPCGNNNGMPDDEPSLNDIVNDVSNSEDVVPDEKRELGTKNNDPKQTRKRNIQKDSDEPLLDDVLNNVPRKLKSRKPDAKSNHIQTGVSKSNGVVIRDLDLNLEYRGEENEQEVIREMLSSVANVEDIQPLCIARDDRLVPENTEHEENDASRSKTHSKLSGIRKFKKALHVGTETQENVVKKSSLSKGKRKRPLIEDGMPSQTEVLKDSDGTRKHNSDLLRKGKKKQVTALTSQEKDEEEVAEILTKIGQEHVPQSNTVAVGSSSNLLLALENVKSDNGPTMIDHAKSQNLAMDNGNKRNINMWNGEGAHEKRVAGMNQSIPQVNPVSNLVQQGYPSTAVNEGQTECRWNCFYQPTMSSKQYQSIDLNQLAPNSATMNPRSGLLVSKYQMYPSRSCSSQNANHNRMDMLALRSEHLNSTTPFHVGSPALLNGNPGFRNVNLNFEGAPQAISQHASYQMNVPGKYPLNLNGGSSFTQGTSFGMNEDKNKNMSASRLLRLMHEKACSGEPGRNSGVPLRPVARLGVLGPLLQKEIATSSKNRDALFSFQGSNSAMRETGRSIAFHSPTVRTSSERMNTIPSASHAIVKETFELGNCTLNENPADFAMVGDKRFMIDHKKPRKRNQQQSRSLLRPSQLKRVKRAN